MLEQAQRKILILFFHPRYEDSNANRGLVEAANSVAGVTLRDLYELYPDFNIDVPKEQAVLLAHDVIIWQHPFYWYSCPPLMKQWIDLVLEHGWAYGHQGDKLAGKWIMNAITSGGNFDLYKRDGRNRFTYRELLAPFDQTAFLCHMVYLPSFIVPGANRVSQEQMAQYAHRYAQVLRLLQAPGTSANQLADVAYFNDLNLD